ncbi:MAG TPA: NACHT domain-containing protein [Anaerolineae bacterium]|nr:NACHT domain-containing protein [Anaerolineae bacterium]
MSDYTEYAESTAQRYNRLTRLGEPDVTLEEGYVPLYARRGPQYAVRELPHAQKALNDARRRAREEQIREVLTQRPYVDLLAGAPLGPAVSVRDVWAEDRLVVLLGKAGAGKSTALRHLAVQRPTGRDGSLLTLIVELGSFAASGQALVDFLAADAAEMGLQMTPAFFRDVLANGQAVVCLDGLDEVADPAVRVRTVEQIEAWTGDYPRTRFLVTAREEAYEPRLNGDKFAHFVLRPWNDKGLEELEAAWDRASAEWTEEEAAAQLEKAPRLVRDIVRAREVAALFAGGKLNAGWKELRAHLWDTDWRERVALIYRVLSQEQPQVWGKVMSLLLEAGERDPYESVTHRHLLLAGLALSASDPTADLDGEVVGKVIDGLFEWLSDAHAAGRQDGFEALFRLAGRRQVGERAVELVSDEEEGAWVRAAAALLLGQSSGVAAGKAVEALSLRIKPIEPSGKEEGSESENEDESGDEQEDKDEKKEEHLRVRQAACTSLGQLALRPGLDEELKAEVEAKLVEGIRDGELPIDVRLAMTEAVAAIAVAEPSEERIGLLFSLARGEGEERPPYAVQVAAGQGLSVLLRKTGDADLMDRLWELCQDQEVDESVRVVVAQALGVQADAERAAHILLEASRDTGIYPPGRRQALEALGRLGYADDAIVEALITIAETQDRKTKDFERLAAAKALGEIGYLDLSLQNLLVLIADKSIYRSTRNDALRLLGEVGLSGDEDLDDASIAVLRIWVTEDRTTEDVQEQAMESLVMLQAAREEVVRDLISVVQDKRAYPRVRRAAVGALARLPIEDRQMVVDSIEVPFYDREEKSDLLRVPTARLLYLWGNDEHAPEYLRLAAEQSYMALVRHLAGIVLHEIGDDENAVPTLRKLATDASIADPIRCDSLRALSFWNVGDRELAEQLLPIFGEEEPMPSVPEAAYEAMKLLLPA